ncbi:MAG: hypothetical protein ACRDPR_01550, partial [Nocardioidaceae bacterium]
VLEPHELAVADDRGAVFRHYLSDAGLTELNALLDNGRHAVTVPEDAALLTVAWLVRAGDRAAALELLDVLRPFVTRLRFAPRPADAPFADAAVVSRRTVDAVRAALEARRPNPRIDAQREATTVWNPFGDQLLTLWLETVKDGRVAATIPPGWSSRAQTLLERYEELAATYRLCGKHRRPKENLAILRTTLEKQISGRLEPRRRGLLQSAVDAMVRRRGVPGSDRHSALRERQRVEATGPTHQDLARLVAARLEPLQGSAGWNVREAVDRPVEEHEATGVPAGTMLPPSVRRTLLSARVGTLAELIELGVVPSAEVLAELVPQISAATTALGYRDESLRR